MNVNVGEHVDATGERVAVLGLTFNPGTDDIQESRAVPVIDGRRIDIPDRVTYEGLTW